MRLVLISDNHDQNLRTKWAIPDGDVLVHIGDLVGVGDKIERFRRGVRNLRRFPHTHKIYVPGNHDRLALTEPDVVRPLFEAAGIKFLLDESHRIGRVTFWGSPWLNPRTGMFGEYQSDMGELWGRVPAGIDVLLTHVPPRRGTGPERQIRRKHWLPDAGEPCDLPHPPDSPRVRS